jgi:hypothetical protein
VQPVLLRLLIVGATVSAAAALFFHGKVREDDARVDGLVRAAVRGVPLADTEAVALALSREVFLRTNRRMGAHELSPYERLESSSFFNVTSAVSLEHGANGLEDQAHIGPCGTMTRVTLQALDRMGIPARKLHLHDEAPRGIRHAMVESDRAAAGSWSRPATAFRVARPRWSHRDAGRDPGRLHDLHQVFARFPAIRRAGSATRTAGTLPRRCAALRTVLGRSATTGRSRPSSTTSHAGCPSPLRLAQAGFAMGAFWCGAAGSRAAAGAG